MFNREKIRLDRWLLVDRSAQAERLNSSTTQLQDRNGRRGVSNPMEEYAGEIIADCQRAIDQGVVLNRTFSSFNIPIDLRGRGREISSGLHIQVDGMGVTHAVPNFSLSDMGVDTLNLFSVGGRGIHLKNLFVRKLRIVDCGDFVAENCWIDTLSLAGAGVRTLRMTGGGIYNVECGVPGSQMPFAGSVYFGSDVFFLREVNDRIERVQQYRNMRWFMLRLENTPMVSLFHTLEQATERRLDKSMSFNRFVSWLYELLRVGFESHAARAMRRTISMMEAA